MTKLIIAINLKTIINFKELLVKGCEATVGAFSLKPRNPNLFNIVDDDFSIFNSLDVDNLIKQLFPFQEEYVLAQPGKLIVNPHNQCARYFSNYISNNTPPLFLKVLETLRQLKNNGYVLAIVTDGTEIQLNNMLEKLTNLYPGFASFFTTSLIINYKDKDQESNAKILESLFCDKKVLGAIKEKREKLKPADVVMVGCGQSDIQMVQKVGVDLIVPYYQSSMNGISRHESYVYVEGDKCTSVKFIGYFYELLQLPELIHHSFEKNICRYKGKNNYYKESDTLQKLGNNLSTIFLSIQKPLEVNQFYNTRDIFSNSKESPCFFPRLPNHGFLMPPSPLPPEPLSPNYSNFSMLPSSLSPPPSPNSISSNTSSNEKSESNASLDSPRTISSLPSTHLENASSPNDLRSTNNKTSQIKEDKLLLNETERLLNLVYGDSLDLRGARIFQTISGWKNVNEPLSDFDKGKLMRIHEWLKNLAEKAALEEQKASVSMSRNY